MAAQPEFQLEPLEPPAALDAQVRSRAHAALRASRLPAPISRFELALTTALAGAYAIYTTSQVMQIFARLI